MIEETNTRGEYHRIVKVPKYVTALMSYGRQIVSDTRPKQSADLARFRLDDPEMCVGTIGIQYGHTI